MEKLEKRKEKKRREPSQLFFLFSKRARNSPYLILHKSAAAAASRRARVSASPHTFPIRGDDDDDDDTLRFPVRIEDRVLVIQRGSLLGTRTTRYTHERRRRYLLAEEDEA